MSELLLPPKVAHEIAQAKFKEDRDRRRILAQRLLDFDDDPTVREWKPVLQRVDPRLKLGRARPQAYEAGMNVKPGYFHWYRDNSDTGAADTIEPITGPDGESFMVPDSGFLERLRGNDLQDPVVWRAIIQERAQAEAAYERELEERKDARMHGALDRALSKENASVSMSRGAWSASVAGRKGSAKKA